MMIKFAPNPHPCGRGVCFCLRLRNVLQLQTCAFLRPRGRATRVGWVSPTDVAGLSLRRRRSPSSPRAVSSPRPAAQTRGRGRKPSPQAGVWAGTKHAATSNFPPPPRLRATFCLFAQHVLSRVSVPWVFLRFPHLLSSGARRTRADGGEGRRGSRGGKRKRGRGKEEGAAAAVREEELVKGDRDRRAPEKESDAAVCCSRNKVRALSSAILSLTAGRWRPPPPPRPHPPGGAKVVFPSPLGAGGTVTGRGGDTHPPSRNP